MKLVRKVIDFQKTVKQTKILSPLKNFTEETITFEYRTDPLTGRNTTVIKGMLSYVGKFLVSDNELLKSLVDRTKATCPFCPESIPTKTPMFIKTFLPTGRISIGETTVVPNLLGHAEQSILAILSKKHHLKLDEFTPQILLDGFKGAIQYLKRLRETDASIRYPTFVFNYLTPSGSSIFHPHMQILARDIPFYLVNLELEKSKAYFESNGSSFWRDLLRTEIGGERHILTIGGTEWGAPFASLRGLNEVQAIVNGKSNLLELSETDWLDVSEGISKVLKFYHSQGYSTFNIVIASGPVNEHLEYFDVNLRVINRPGIQEWCFSDAWAVPYLLWDGEAVEEPEIFAEKVRDFIKKT
jgi:UDPglucose--hexose-1-phosphate uridylyltransferase